MHPIYTKPEALRRARGPSRKHRTEMLSTQYYRSHFQKKAMAMVSYFYLSLWGHLFLFWIGPPSAAKTTKDNPLGAGLYLLGHFQPAMRWLISNDFCHPPRFLTAIVTDPLPLTVNPSGNADGSNTLETKICSTCHLDRNHQGWVPKIGCFLCNF